MTDAPRAQCPYCKEEVHPEAVLCKHCHSALTPRERDLSAIDAEGDEPQAAPSTVLPMIAAGLSVLAALWWGGIGLLQLGLAGAGVEGGSAPTGFWNILCAGVDVAGAVGLFLRKRWGYEICFWTSIINIPWGLWLVWKGAFLATPAVLIYILVVILLLFARKEFVRALPSFA